jgi:N-acyl-D-amino-acid deacylase
MPVTPSERSSHQIGTCKDLSISHYSSRLISAVAEEEGIPPIEVFFVVLTRENLAANCIMHVGDEENVREIMLHSTHCGGSDAILHGDSLHPRAFGTFPRFIGESHINLLVNQTLSGSTNQRGGD